MITIILHQRSCRAIDLEKAEVFYLFDTMFCLLCVMDRPKESSRSKR